MRIVVDIGHPAHVHLFKNFVWRMKAKGHEILITATKKDVSLELLNSYGFDYVPMGSYGSSTIKKMVNVPIMDLKMYRAVRAFQPDILVGVAPIRATHVSRLIRKPCIGFDDNEYSKVENSLYLPFTDVVLTPSCFKKDLGKKHVRYNGYKELAYLHPNYFQPDPSVLDELGLTEDDKFVILRFVSWHAVHDIGQYGFDTQAKSKLVSRLVEYAKVFITSETPLPAELEKYRIPVSPKRLHDLLYYASMLVGDCGTTAAEAGILGTPVVRYNSFVGPNDLGFLVALEQKDGLIYSFKELDQAMAKAEEILASKNIKQEWAEKRAKLISNSIDVTAFVCWFIENYPESFRIMKETPDYQDKFKQA